MNDPIEYRFYGELARWWPLISPPEEYRDESEFVASLLGRAAIPVQRVLELGSGGGHVASHLRRYQMTLVDLSEEMLSISRTLNPESEHVQGDMRTIRLGREFDAVLIYDAIDYMTSKQDLALAMETAFVHCRPGGIALFVPDHIRENLVLDTDHGGYDGPDNRAVRYLEWSTDPDPADATVRTEYVFVLRDNDDTIRVVHETHVTGIFSRADWRRILDTAGFTAEAIVEETAEDRLPRELFLAHRLAV